MTPTCRKNESGFSLVELTIVSVVLVVIIGIMATVVSSVQSSYASQRPRTEALNDATAALDQLTRLIRMAGNNPTLIPNLKGINPGTAAADGAYHTIRIRSDWHQTSSMSGHPDGDTDDSLENILFSVSNNRLMKQETPDDASPVVFLDNVNDITFTYFDSDNLPIANPVLSVDLIARVDVNLVIRASDGVPMTFTSSAFLRQRF